MAVRIAYDVLKPILVIWYNFYRNLKHINNQHVVIFLYEVPHGFTLICNQCQGINLVALCYSECGTYIEAQVLKSGGYFSEIKIMR